MDCDNINHLGNELIYSTRKTIENKKEYFKSFARNGISFENWLTIELLHDLNRSDIKAEMTPAIAGCSKRLDLRLTHKSTDTKAAIEIKIAHLYTQNKYWEEIVKDVHKLSNLNNEYYKEKYLLILSCFIKESAYINSWDEWFKKINDEAITLANKIYDTDIEFCNEIAETKETLVANIKLYKVN